MSDLTPETIAHLRELDAARTQGAWFAASEKTGKRGAALVGLADRRGQGDAGCIAVLAGGVDLWRTRNADAEFIAAAANHMSALLDAVEERDKAKRAAKTLGEVVHQNCHMILDVTGLHDWIDEDGDGDWGAVWENAYELLPRIKAAEAEVSRLRAELAGALTRAETAEATIERVDQKMLEYVHINEVVKRSSLGASGPTMLDQIRAALTPATQREEGE